MLWKKKLNYFRPFNEGKPVHAIRTENTITRLLSLKLNKDNQFASTGNIYPCAFLAISCMFSHTGCLILCNSYVVIFYINASVYVLSIKIKKKKASPCERTKKKGTNK